VLIGDFMQTRKRVLVSTSLFAFAVVTVAVIYFLIPREPSYQGKTLSTWIEPFCQKTATGLNAPAGPQHFEELQPVRRAVVAMGTNAVPFLIAKLNLHDSFLQRMITRVRAKQPIAALKPTDPNINRIRAVRALAVLGPVATPAITNLAEQLGDVLVAENAVYALSGMGPEGMRALVAEYPNVNPLVRMQIAMTLLHPSMTYRGEDKKPLQASQIPTDIRVDGLCCLMKDPSAAYRMEAIMQLETLGPAASNAVPDLLSLTNDWNLSTRMMAVRALDKIKAPAD